MRYEIHFSGHVQGVGFRYTSKQIARSYDIEMAVENLPDGRVRMIVDGNLAVIEAYIAEVCESTSGHVAKVETKQFPPPGGPRIEASEDF